MLPGFPESQKILNEAWSKHMFAVKNKIFPLEIHPPVLQIVEGKTTDFQREDRTVKPLHISRHQVRVQHHIEEQKGMTIETFLEKAKEAGEGIGKQMWEMLTGAVSEAARETGNELKIKKGNLTQENVLQMLETLQQNFDEHGNPIGQLVCGSEFSEELRNREKEWREDKQFLARIEAVITRKRAEYNEREARRRLVD